MRGIEELLAAARARLDRPDPDAPRRWSPGARSSWTPGRAGSGIRRVTSRARSSIERNHLEWRLDPTSAARIPQAVDHDVTWIVVCSEGYASSLAAASLQDLGLRNATDLDGGFRAWKAAGLPVGLSVSRAGVVCGGRSRHAARYG